MVATWAAVRGDRSIGGEASVVRDPVELHEDSADAHLLIDDAMQVDEDRVEVPLIAQLRTTTIDSSVTITPRSASNSSASR